MNPGKHGEPTTETTTSAQVETAAEQRLERFSRFLALGAVRAVEGRTPNHQDAGKQSSLSKTEQSAANPPNISEASGG